MKGPLLAATALVLALPVHAGLLDNLKTQAQQAVATTATTTPTTTTATQSTGLVDSVMSQLNLNQTQAEGGLGSLLTLAQSNLGTSQFSQITDAIPNASSLMSAVPATDSSSGMTGLLSKAGSLGTSLQGSAMVYDAFSKLGISKDLVAPMAEILKNYLQSSGGDSTASLLTQGLGSLL